MSPGRDSGHGGASRRRACARSGRPAAAWGFFEGVLANIPVLPFGLAEARIHAHVWTSLAAAGTLIGAHNLQIAATALAAGSVLATLNQDEFHRVPALSLAPLPDFLAPDSDESRRCLSGCVGWCLYFTAQPPATAPACK